MPRLEPILLPFRVLCKGVYPITNSCVETTHPPLDGSVVIFITSNSVIIQIWWLGCAKLSYVNRSSRIYFWFRMRLTLSFFPELRFIKKHTTCSDLTLLRGPHPAVQKGGLPVGGARG